LGGREKRLMRAGLLANYLALHGHDVVWWTSTFDHMQKTHHFPDDTTVKLDSGVELRLLRSLGYRRNVSVRRMLDHHFVARSFERLAAQAPPPDVIMASYPTIDLAGAACRFGATHDIPCVIDIRDLWPDVYSELLPRWIRPLAAPAIALLRGQARSVCRDAFAITGNARSFVEWGLKLARRTARPTDRHFPFGYSVPRVAEARRDAARAYWEERGIRRGAAEVIGCYFGSIGHQSDFGCVVDAAGLLMRRGVKFRMILCGTGERLEELRERARGNPNLMFPGWIEQPEILALMEAAHFGIAPYWNHVGFIDNLPNKPIEYMAGGLAVVTCLPGYLRELITRENCGFHFPPGDAAALASLIEKLAADRASLESAAANARRVFEHNFDADIVQAGITEYLQEIVCTARATAA
jgi:glycosyltransferase involved in cell wall biosynthesis